MAVTIVEASRWWLVVGGGGGGGDGVKRTSGGRTSIHIHPSHRHTLTISPRQALGIVVYRIFFHPLAKYPGPLLAKVTDAYQLYHAYKGDRHLEFWRMHQRYGKIVRFGPNSLSFNSNQALKEIYGFRSNVRKAEFYNAFVHPAANTHNTRDKEVHARKRRVLSHAFSDSAMKEMQRYILGNVRTFCEQVGIVDGGTVAENKGWTKPRDMSHWCNYLAMDILGDLSFGKAFHMLEKPDNRFALELVEAATTRHLIVSRPVTVCWEPGAQDGRETEEES